nr:hypothetical protein [Tanacetum cinerariifolium]
MINSIKNGDQPLPRVTQVSIAINSSTEQPPLKDKSMWYDQKKKIQKIDRLARSLLIQGLLNDIFLLLIATKLQKIYEMLLQDCKKSKVKDYEHYKTKMLLAKKDKAKQVLRAEDHAWIESSSDSEQEINANMVFMTQIEKFLSYSEASSSSADDKIDDVSYYTFKSESESEYE